MGTCVICGSPTENWGKLCTRCIKLDGQRPRNVRRKALIDAFDRTINGFRCYYTGIILDEKDPRSPFHINFDHPVPGDDSRLHACCSFVNELKSAMTEDEFRANIPLLAAHFETGLVLDRNNIRIASFHTHPPRVRVPPELLPPAPRVIRWFSPTCKICGKPPAKRGYYCRRCHNALLGGGDERASKEAAMITAYDREQDGFRCRYTGMLVDMDNPSGPYHISFDHRFPGHPGNLAVCLLIINDMKSALSEEEFIIIVKQLAKHFTTGEPFDLGGVRFEYWR